MKIAKLVESAQLVRLVSKIRSLWLLFRELAIPSIVGGVFFPVQSFPKFGIPELLSESALSFILGQQEKKKEGWEFHIYEGAYNMTKLRR
jgi:hypothetical protein